MEEPEEAGSDQQKLEDAKEYLNRMINEFRGQPLALIAQRMLDTFDRPAVFPSAGRGVSRVLNTFSERTLVIEADKVLKKREPGKKSPNYKTPVFKCLEDYEECKRSSSSTHLCRAALFICIGKHIVPFTR